MNLDTSKYKNIDKSTSDIFYEKGTFFLINICNETDITEFKKYTLDGNYIQLYFSLSNKITIAFNEEHCAIHITPESSGLIYFKDANMELLIKLYSGGHLLGLFISVPYFHSLFTQDKNSYFDFANIKGGRPLIKEKTIPLVLKIILRQIASKKSLNPLDKLYIKGKIYELLSLYFDIYEENERDNCPFIANEETIAQIKKAKDIMIKNMAHPPSLDELSIKVGLNIKKLKIGFKEFYGTPVFTFLLNHKLSYSRRLLEENKMNVSEIASQIGYSNSSHFIAAFKKKI